MITNRINNTNRTNFKSRPITEKELDELGKSIKSNRVMAYPVDMTHAFMDQQIIKRPDGIRDGLPVPGADKIVSTVGKIKKLIQSTMLKLRSNDAHKFGDPELKYFKGEPFNSDIHSEKGTHGAESIPEADFGKPDALIEVEPEKQDVPSVEQIKGIIAKKGFIQFEKNETSPFKYGVTGTDHVVPNKKGIELFHNLKSAGIDKGLIYGVAEEYCDRDAAAALKQVGIQPIVIKDAVKEISVKSLDDPNDEVYGDVVTITSEQLAKVLNKA